MAWLFVSCAWPSGGPGGTSTGSGSGSSGTTATSSASTSTGSPVQGSGGVMELSADGGSCQPGGDPLGARWELCTDTRECPCPLRCVYDARDWGGAFFGQGLCASPCQATSDCPLLSAVCDGVGCVPDACGGPETMLDGGQNGALLGPCAVNVPGDGTCLPAPVGESSFDAACVLAGTSAAACDLAATREQPGSSCGPGQVCLQTRQGSSSGLCSTLCFPGSDGGGCLPEQACAAFDRGIYAAGGVCVPVTDAGCAMAASSPHGGCVTSADCACPAQCFVDPLQRVGSYPGVCELPCQTSSDCPALSTACRAGSCRQVYCSTGPLGEPEPGAIDGPCDSAGQADGTCIQSGLATGADGAPQPRGICWQAGAATGACDPNATRSDPSLTCPVGAWCIAGLDGGSTCDALCDPTQDGGSCLDGTVCFPVEPGNTFGTEAHSGSCEPCRAPGYACDLGPECCSGNCQAGSCR